MGNAHPNCPKCGSTKVVKNGFVLWNQRYKCMNKEPEPCSYQFTVQNRENRRNPKNAERLPSDKTIALALYLLGYSMDAVGELIGASTQTISRWLKTHGSQYKKMRVQPLKRKELKDHDRVSNYYHCSSGRLIAVRPRIVRSHYQGDFLKKIS